MSTAVQTSLIGEETKPDSPPAKQVIAEPGKKACQTSPGKSLPGTQDEAHIKYLIETDRYILDTRCWPDGITKQEFFKLWNKGFRELSPQPDKSGRWWNAGHFGYAMDKAKEKGTVNPEVIWSYIEQYKEVHLWSFVRSWKAQAELNLKTSKDYSEKGSSEMARLYRGYARNCWDIMNRCLRELGMPEESIPERLIEEEV